MGKSILKGIGNTLRIAIKLVLAVLLIVGSFLYLDKVFAKKDVDRGESFHVLPENSLDIGVIGSSHSQYSFIPSFIYNDLGLYSYVLGTPCQPLEVSYLMLKELYKTQSPKLIVLEVYTALPLSKGCEGDNCYITAALQARGQEKRDMLSYVSEDKQKAYLNEFINNHNNWRTVTSLEELKPLEEQTVETTGNAFGFVDAYPMFPVENSWSPLQYDYDVDIELREKDLNALNGILQLCKEHGSELILYKTPVDGITVEDQSMLKKVWKWADDNGIKHLSFIELADKLGYHMQTHTNSGHAYINGAAIITNYISDYIKDNFKEVFNHKDNEILNKKYSESYYEYLKGSSLNEYNPMVYLNRIAKHKGVVVVRYNKWAGSMTKDLANKLVSLGLKEGFNENCYYAIFNNGQLIAESTEPFEQEINGKIIKISTDNVYLDGNEIEGWTGSPMSITVFNEKMDNWFIKRINTQTNWEFGYTFYGN